MLVVPAPSTTAVWASTQHKANQSSFTRKAQPPPLQEGNVQDGNVQEGL